MTLERYRKKRNFGKTSEPRGSRSRGNSRLHFVIQKHDASHLHYDLRLENRGVLKSWAVPKGISLNPEDRRLAIEVEDHPFEYRDFEGTIPEGNYGAGQVIVWDEGEYLVDEGLSKEANEKKIQEGLDKGHLKFVLHGKKLHGQFSLVKLNGKKTDKKQWLLIKKPDEFANQKIADEDVSVKTGRTLEDVARSEESPAEELKPATVFHKYVLDDINWKGVPESDMPHTVKPMLATLADKPFDKEGWLFEIKWDGYRAVSQIQDGKVRLYSRNNKTLNDAYPEVIEDLSRYPYDAVFDGEVVAVDDKGVSRFQLLQNYGRSESGNGTLLYYIFDVLYLDGHDLRKLPLSRRKEILHAVVPESSVVWLSDYLPDTGIAFYEAARQNGLEGVIAKKMSAPYREGSRSSDWLKIKIVQTEEAIICGFTEPRGSRKHIGSVILGVYDNKQLRYAGHSGSGLTYAGIKALHAKLTPLITEQCPFEVKPKTNAPATWVKPTLLCEVKFQEWTDDGHMRQPIFLGLREDKSPKDVHEEKPWHVDAVLKDEKKPRTTKKEVSVLEETPLKAAITHPDKVFWPEEGYTKGDVVRYYQEIASFILPYLKDRPQALNRHPNGITGKNFFQKDVGRTPPGWVETVAVESESRKSPTRYIVCQDKDALAYINNLGCIEVNTWTSRVQWLDCPDFLVFDLDPVQVSFETVVEVAVQTRAVLENLNVESYCKTSGSKGLHIYVPLGHLYTFDQTKDLAHVLCSLIHNLMPDVTSLERSPKNRKGRVYLDYLQNHYTATMAAPYAVRPKPYATVSAPLEWKEVNKKLDPTAFTIKTMPKRLNKKGDLWKGVLGKGINMEAVLQAIEEKY